MRRFGVILMCVLCLCLLGGCGETMTVVGTWATDDPLDYSFRLTDDGRCVMLDPEGNWVSDGSYRTDDDRVYFETDTGDFVWLRTDDGMLFHANGHERLYNLR